MITRKWSKKAPSFRKGWNYMEKGSEKGLPLIKCELLSLCSGKEEILREFQANAKYIKPRKNGNYWYHEALSFHPEDKPRITPEILEDIGQKFIEMRTKGKALVVGMIHMEANVHIHFMISANEYQIHTKIDLKNKEFFALKRGIEAYQRTRYPFLKHSIVYDQKPKLRNVQKTNGEHERDRRLSKEGKTPARSEKETVRSVVLSCLGLTNGEKSFKKVLAKHGYRFYLRGKTPGVQKMTDKKKPRFRLSTLGLAEVYAEMRQRWEMVRDRKGQLPDLRREQNRDYSKAPGLRERSICIW